MKITISILAWNEREVIEKTLTSLFCQSLLLQATAHRLDIDLFCVINGSTDGTIEVVNNFKSRQSPIPGLRFEVHVVATSGKANAWNVLVHEASDPMTDLYFFVDADIVFSSKTTLQDLLLAFTAHPSAIVVTDIPIKQLPKNEPWSIWNWAQRRSAMLTTHASEQICGQLYGIKGSFAKVIWMPLGLIIEDGFLKSLVVTNLWKNPIISNSGRIIRVDSASHTFTAYASLSEIFRQQLRQAIGQSINAYLLESLRKQLQKDPGLEVGALIEQLNQNNNNWLAERIYSRSQEHFWMLYPGAFTARFHRLKRIPWLTRIRLIPVAILGLLFDLPVLLLANYRLHRPLSLQSFWKKDA